MGIIDHTGAQTMLYLTWTMVSIVDLAHYRVSCGKVWVSVDLWYKIGIKSNNTKKENNI